MSDLQVIVAGRYEGKTTALLEWLSRGCPIPTYPGWSRALVVAHDSEVGRLCQLVGSVEESPWRKNIWTLRDLESVHRFSVKPGTVEYAIDDLDVLIRQLLPGRVHMPAVVGLSGRAYDPDADVVAEEPSSEPELDERPFEQFYLNSRPFAW